VRVESQQLQVDGTTWLPLADFKFKRGVAAGVAVSGAQLADVGSVVPMTAETIVCIDPSGKTTLSTDGTCPGNTNTGATLFVRSADTGNQKHKVVIYGLTGLAKVLDRW
jgi:hypothetical protein